MSWAIPDEPNISIVGATGVVGSELLRVIEERSFPHARLRLIASGRSAGSTIEVRGQAVEVLDLGSYDFSGDDISFFCAGTKVSLEHAPRAAGKGALVIDNTNAFRMAPECPLIVPQVNAPHMDERPASNIIGNPNCSTIQLVRVLDPIRRAIGIERVVVSTYQAASGAGRDLVDALHADSAAFSEETEPSSLAFNLIPEIGRRDDAGVTLEEQKMTNETRKILGDPAFRLTATCVRVPVVNAHSEAVHLRCACATTVAEIAELLSGAEDVVVHGDDYRTPREQSGEDTVSVGRIRVDPEDPRDVWLWVVADNLRVGAALNAIQIAERALSLVPRGHGSR